MPDILELSKEFLDRLDQGLGDYLDREKSKPKVKAPEPEYYLPGTLNDEVLNALTPREEKVMKLFYGYKCNPQPVKAIAKHFGLSKERIHQILAKVHRKLNFPRYQKLMQTV